MSPELSLKKPDRKMARQSLEYQCDAEHDEPFERHCGTSGVPLDRHLMVEVRGSLHAELDRMLHILVDVVDRTEGHCILRVSA